MGADCVKAGKGIKRRVYKIKINKRSFVNVKEGNLNDEYELTSMLSMDKFSEIRKCVNRQTGKTYNAKVYRITEVNPKILHTFYDEVDLLREADHPNIVRLIDIYKDSTNATIITEDCKGGDLLTKINEGLPLPENKVAGYIKDILSGVAYLHSKNIAHRNLRPEVFSFLSRDDDSCLKITDFESCRHSKLDVFDLEDIGSPPYKSPDGILWNINTSKCDIWSIGVMAFWMLSGKLPFEGQTEFEICQSVSRTKLTFEEEVWKKVSYEGREILCRMLNKFSNLRSKAKELLEHDWIKNRGQDSAANDEILNSTLISLSHFKAKSLFQRAILTFIVSQIMSSEENSDLGKVFQSIDKNGDGFLSKEEIQASLTKIAEFSDYDVNKFLANIDINGNQMISYSEFLVTAVNWEKELSQERLNETFKILDKDHSGKICKQELMAVFGGRRTNPFVFERMIEEADKNHDGEIDFEEFCSYFNRINTINYW